MPDTAVASSPPSLSLEPQGGQQPPSSSAAVCLIPLRSRGGSSATPAAYGAPPAGETEAPSSPPSLTAACAAPLRLGPRQSPSDPGSKAVVFHRQPSLSSRAHRPTCVHLP